MALVVKDRVKQTTTTTGTGNIVLNGNVDGFQTFAAALTDGDTTYFGIFVPSTNDYEVGLGTWTEGSATLARTTILESSNSGSAINITAQAEVFITQPAEKAVFQDANGDVDLGGNKILFGNLYSTTGDLPSASTYHGMFAHVHGTGKAYYAHGGNWIELVNEDTSGNVSMGGNLTVTGDLTVNGTTTTVNTTNTVVTDSLIELGNGTSGSPSNDAGIVIERGSSDNAFIGYDESADKFTVGTGSFTGATTGNLTISTGTLVANVEGNVTGNVTGNVSGSSGSTTGNAATATALATARNIGGVSFDGTGNIDLAGVNSAGNQNTSGNAATATALANARTIGGVSFDGTGNINLPGVNTSGNQNTSGNAATATTAGTVTTAAQTNITSLGTLTSLTVDDITINGSTISDGGDFTLDVGGDIILDATGGEVRFSDGSQQEFVIDMNDAATKTTLRTLVSDSDLVFEGNDGGVGFVALTLDMSDAGSAYFNNKVGISTSSPTGTLSVSDATYLSNSSTLGSSITLNSENTASWSGSRELISFESVGNGADHRTGTLSVKLKKGASDSTLTEYMQINAVSNYTTFSTDGSERMRLTNTGLGIGTSSPSEKLVLANSSNEIKFGLDGSSHDIFSNGKTFNIGTTDDTVVRMFQNNSEVMRLTNGGVQITDGSLAEDYDALSGTTPTCNVDNGGMFSLTMSGNTTFTFSGASSGYSQGFILQLTGNGSTVTYPNTVRWAGGTAPDAPANGETDILVFISRDGGSNWYGVLASDAAA